jgi:hypothetical protein
VVLAVLVPAAAPEDQEAIDPPHYRDVAPALGITRKNDFGSPAKKQITETTGSGAAFFDYDLDGDLDLYVVNGKTLEQAEAGLPGLPDQLFRNQGTDHFEEVGASAGIVETEWGGGAAAADYDNDGDPDLLVTNNGRSHFYRNNGDGTFTEITARAGLEDEGWSTSAAWGDVDADGFLDLYVCHYIAFDPSLLTTIDPQHCRWRGLEVMCGPNGLPGESDVLYRNQGDGTFSDITQTAGVENPEGKGLGVTFLDFDGDGDQDIYVANDSTPHFLYENQGSGRFKDIALVAGVALSMYGKPQAGMGLDQGDYDEDGRPDLIVTNFQGDYNALRHNDGGGIFTDVSDLLGVTASSFDKLGWGVRFLDANLDGFLDLFVVNGHVYPEVDGSGIGEAYAQRNQLLVNVPAAGGRGFKEMKEGAGPGLLIERSGRGLASADYDGDGDLDLFINNNGDRPTFLRDEAAHRNGWIRLGVIGREANRDGLGARIEYVAGGVKHHRSPQTASYLSTSDGRTLLGLGAAAAADVTVWWPGNAGPIRLNGVRSGEEVWVLEGVGRIRRPLSGIPCTGTTPGLSRSSSVIVARSKCSIFPTAAIRPTRNASRTGLTCTGDASPALWRDDEF